MLEKKQLVCWFKYSKPPMKCTKILSALNEKDNNSTLCEITFQIFKNLIDMKLGLNFLFD